MTRLRLLRGRASPRACRHADGKFLAEPAPKDAFGHAQLGGVGAAASRTWCKRSSGYKYHWAVADYLQRAARHIASKADVEQAYAVGKAAVELALKGMNAVMPTIVRKSAKPYRWTIGHGAARRGGEQGKEDCRATTSPPTASASPTQVPALPASR